MPASYNLARGTQSKLWQPMTAVFRVMASAAGIVPESLDEQKLLNVAPLHR